MKESREKLIKASALILAAMLFAAGYMLLSLHTAKKSEEDIERRPITTTVYSAASQEDSRTLASEEIVYPIDINKATVKELTGVAGIGGVTAGRIIDYRTRQGAIHDIAELVEIDGIGDELCELIAGYFYVDEAEYVMYTASVDTSSKNNTQTKSSGSRTTTVRTTTAAVTSKKASFPIDINKVTRDELVQIDGVGESVADRILAFRSSKGKITDMEQLLEIYGIGNDRLSMLSQYLYVSQADYSKASVTTTLTTAAAQTTTVPPKTTSQISVSSAVSSSSVQTATTAEETKQQRRVNINEANAEEIADSLLIDIEDAEMIVALREKIHGYSNILEVLYLEEFDSKYDTAFYNSIKDYIYV